MSAGRCAARRPNPSISSNALPEETNEPELLEKHRLVWALNRQSPSRLYWRLKRTIAPKVTESRSDSFNDCSAFVLRNR